MVRRLLGCAARLLPLALLLIAVAALLRMARHLDWAALRAALDALQGQRALLAGLATVAGYAALVAIDALACRAVDARPRWSQIATVGLIGHALTHSLGNAALVGGAVRSRYYTLWGLAPSALARVVASTACAPVLGACAVAGVLGVTGGTHVRLLHLPTIAWCLALVPPALYLGWSSTGRPVAWGRARLALPPLPLAALQLLLGAVEVGARAIVLACAVPPAAGIPIASLLLAFVPALIAGKLSQVPGGIGVVEGCVLALVMPAHRPAALGALALYRAIYDAAPLLLAVLAAGIFEALVRVLPRASASGTRIPGLLLRPLLAAAATLAGLAAALCAVAPWSPAWWPGAPARGAQLVLGIAGIALLWASRAVERRLAEGWWLSVVAGVAAAVAGLACGARIAAALAGLAVVVTFAGARECPRRGGLARARTTRTWTILTLGLLVVGGAIAVAVPPVAQRLPGLEMVAVEAAFALGLLAWRVLSPAPPWPPACADGLAAHWGRLVHQAAARDPRVPGPDDRLLLAEDGCAALLLIPPPRPGGRWLLLPQAVGPPQGTALLALAWRARDVLIAHGAGALIVEDEDRALAHELGANAVSCGTRGMLLLPRPGTRAALSAPAPPHREGVTTAVDASAQAALAQAQRAGRVVQLLTVAARGDGAQAWAVLEAGQPVAAVLAAGGPGDAEGAAGARRLLQALAQAASQAGAAQLALGFLPDPAVVGHLAPSGWYRHPAGASAALAAGAQAQRCWACGLGGTDAATAVRDSMRAPAWTRRLLPA